MRSPPVFRPMVWFAVAFLAGYAAVAVAGTSTKFTLPVPGAQPSTFGGLTLTVETDWVQNYGYRPVHVQLKAVKAISQPRVLTLELGIGDWSRRNYVTVSQTVELPAGSTSVEQMVLVPQADSTQIINVRSFAAGREIEELSLEGQTIGNGQYWGDAAAVPRILFVRDQPPDVSKFRFLSTMPYSAYGNNNVNFSQLKDVFAFAHRTLDQLYEEALCYSELDIVLLSLDDARDLSTKYPKAWDALCRWMRSGGTLGIYGAGSSWENLSEIEMLLGIPHAGEGSHSNTQGWESPDVQLFEDTVAEAMAAVKLAEAEEAAADVNAPQPAPNKVTSPKAPKPTFKWRTVLFGQVVAVSEKQPFPGREETWRWMLTSLNPNRTWWITRQGSVPSAENPQFNDFLIGDVGLPPIRTYRVLITLFVVFIGPVNYWLLRRSGRLHLFLFTVPIAALITSGGLLAYALMSDGLVSRLRARSLTHLDQQIGESASVARLSYYVGLAPSDGLSFPNNVLITPLELEPTEFGTRRMNWIGGQQLVRGWLGSRSPTQYMTARAQRNEGGLEIATITDSTALSIRNRLGTRIQSLLVRDEAGNWHSAGPVDVDRLVPLNSLASEVEIDSAAGRFLKLLKTNAPQYPDTMTAYGARENWLWFGRRRYYNSNANVDSSLSLLEAGLDQLRAEILSRSLNPRSYVAIVDRPPEIAVGLEGLTETQSLHVIHGTW